MNRYLDQIEKSAGLLSAAKGLGNKARSYSASSIRADADSLNDMQRKLNTARAHSPNGKLTDAFAKKESARTSDLSRRVKTRQAAQIGAAGLGAGALSGAAMKGLSRSDQESDKNNNR